MTGVQTYALPISAAVYAALAPQSRVARVFDPHALRVRSLDEARAALSNDLERAAELSHPELGAFRELLEEHAPGAFRVAGSGSSCFAFFSDARSAESALARIEGASRRRRYALRARWVGPAHSRGLERLGRESH